MGGRRWLALVVAVAWWGRGGDSFGQAPAGPKPNVVVILADDLGRADYSACGTRDIRTPNIDRIFREGMTFDNFYANSCVCSPTRAAFLTGRHPDRVGVPGVIRTKANASWGRLDPRVPLLPQVLKPAGYHSTLVGKWHLGLTAPSVPNDRGFDSFRGFLGDMMDDYWTHRREGENLMRRDRAAIDPQGHATDLFTDWACETVAERARERRPFFLFLAYNAPHDPVQPPPAWLERVRAREPRMTEKRAKLVALIEHMDDGVGRVLEALTRAGVADDTLVVFTSDNGGLLTTGADNGPYRAGKGHLYEGGLRVPCAARWPGKIAAGSRTGRLALTMDLFATVADAAGATAPSGLDAVSLLPTLLGRERAEPSRDHYFVYREGGKRFGRDVEAVRLGDWKLVQDDPFGPAELFNLKTDPRETTDLAAREPETFHKLAVLLRNHIHRSGSVPWQPPPNP